MKYAAFFILVVALAILAALPSLAAQQQCAPRQVIIDFLTGEKYREQLRIEAAGSVIVEVYGNEDTGTWTVVTTDPSGMTCIRASGDKGFAVLEPVALGDPA